MRHTAHVMMHVIVTVADAKEKPWRPCRKVRALGL
jgi:hypothetical protein